MKNYILAFICVAGGLASGCLEIEISQETTQKEIDEIRKANCEDADGTYDSTTNQCIGDQVAFQIVFRFET